VNPLRRRKQKVPRHKHVFNFSSANEVLLRRDQKTYKLAESCSPSEPNS